MSEMKPECGQPIEEIFGVALKLFPEQRVVTPGLARTSQTFAAK